MSVLLTITAPTIVLHIVGAPYILKQNIVFQVKLQFYAESRVVHYQKSFKQKSCTS